jgi:pimeloyl-ACP methyl ester carboxylesterase
MALMGIAVVVIAAAVVTFGLLRSRMQPRFPYMSHPLSDADYAALAARPGWHAQRLVVGSGIELRGLMREPAAPGGAWVMFFNGNSAQMLREGQQMLDQLCAERGWGGVVWAYRGYDSSGGRPDPATLEDDGFSAYLALLEQKRIQPDSVHLVGFSLGTDIAAAVAARAASSPPASLTLLAPMTSLYLGERTQLRLHRYETSQWLGKIASPALVIHGANDATLPIENGKAVAASLGSGAKFLELPDLGHYELPLAPSAQRAMRDFIAGHITSIGPPPAAP